MEPNSRHDNQNVRQYTRCTLSRFLSATSKLTVLAALALCINLSGTILNSSMSHAATFLKFTGGPSDDVSETRSTYNLRLTLNGADTCLIEGELMFSGDAQQGEDFNPPTLTFALQSGAHTDFPIMLIDDTIIEGDEYIEVSVRITAAPGCDGIVNNAEKTIKIIDDEIGLPPEARDDPDIQTRIDQPVTIDVLANDLETGPLLEIFEVSSPANGTAIANLSNTITYTPNEGFVGSDSFNYTITDGTYESTATVTVTVTPGVTDAVDDGADSGGGGSGDDEEQEPIPLPQAIDLSCTTGASEVLKQRCRELSRLSSDALTGALNDISARQLPAQGTHLVEIGATQIRNIERRLISLRRGQTDVLALQELSIKMGRDVLPGTLIGAALFEQQSTTDEPTETTVVQNPDEVMVDKGSSPIGVFVGGLVDTGDKENTRKEAGFDFSTYGLTIGADYRLSPDQVIGAALGFADTSSDFVDSSGSNDSDALTASVYGSYHVPEVFFVDWVLSAGQADFRTDRVIRYPGFESQTDGDTQGNFLGLGVTGGLEKHIGGGWILSPYGRLELLKLDIDKYIEKGGDGLALIVDEQSIDSLKLALAVEISKAIKTRNGSIVPSFYIEWENQLADSEREILARFAENPIVPFAIETDSPDSSYFNIGASITAILRERFAGYVSVESRAGQDDIRKNSVNLGIRITF